MKLLITGAGSYVGTKAADYIQDKEPEWTINRISVKTDDWKKLDFSEYNVIFHVAGLAHIRITPENESLYYTVNRNLAVEVAQKAKESGVQHFIFMSSMSVYSDSATFIDDKTPTNPDNVYGKSKLQAEQRIMTLASDSFIVSVIRPPMIYGKGCKGNYNTLRAIALKSPVFPKVGNKRSMLFIDNFSEFLYQLIKNQQAGMFYPQNAELVNTTEWVKYIAEEHGKTVYMSSFLGWCVKLGMHIPIIKEYCIKAFGDSYYNPEMSKYSDMRYQIVGFRESIRKTEL